MKLNVCIPKDKHDTEAIERARTVGFPNLNPILPELLGWLKDGNWPVAASTASLLSGADAEIVPHIKTILSSDDSIWKYWVILLVVRKLKPAMLDQLNEELVLLSNNPTRSDQTEGVDEVARDTILEQYSQCDLPQ